MILYFENKVKWFKCVVAGEPGANPGDGRAPEIGGAPKAHAGRAPTLETEAGDLRADPGGLIFKTAL